MYLVNRGLYKLYRSYNHFPIHIDSEKNTSARTSSPFFGDVAAFQVQHSKISGHWKDLEVPEDGAASPGRAVAIGWSSGNRSRTSGWMQGIWPGLTVDGVMAVMAGKTRRAWSSTDSISDSLHFLITVDTSLNESTSPLPITNHNWDLSFWTQSFKT